MSMGYSNPRFRRGNSKVWCSVVTNTARKNQSPKGRSYILTSMVPREEAFR